ncbi:hypothetical protein HNQ80_001806 [Anaerosolibacter carboniphilus]|uniref:DUF3298 domain-containing protein n=1 Tax=Anaerosolibacter carboniphilus TaxID=1417629 RepID=A0A841KQL1_9FIRM|nr:WG repeat-containing protein [Anaerosolibacter carboniphilus]MBB6215717.1 hypothetical protein [Anaerosolibacter carboniphilus]
MEWTIPVSNLIQHALPEGATIIKSSGPHSIAEIQMAHLDGDGTSEIAVGYLFRGEPYVLVLKSNGPGGYRRIIIKGKGYGINYLGFANITGKEHKDLLIGWQVGAAWGELDIYAVEDDKLRKVVEQMLYSRIEVGDMSGKDGKAEIALWTHDTGEAYKIDVLRWNGEALVQAEDAYHHYFRKVVNYYEKKVKEMPTAAFYWYYLADAQLKAGMPEKALSTVEKGMALGMAYPGKDAFEKLKNEIQDVLNHKNIRLYPASESKIGGIKWGYINETGRVSIGAHYDWAEDFQKNGLAVVTIDNLSGIIDQKGKYVVMPKYGGIGEFSEGRAIVWDSKGMLLIDEKGNVVFKTKDYLGGMQGGRSLFSEENETDGIRYGFIDRNGVIVIPAQYKTAGNFIHGKAVVQLQDDAYAVIDVDGEILQRFHYAFVGDVREGLMPFKLSVDGKFGFIDEKGTIVITPRFDGVQGFQEGRAIVSEDENYQSKYGLIDKTGKYIIPPKYNDIRFLGEGKIAVGVPIQAEVPFAGSRYAIGNLEGNLLTDFDYYDVTDYRQGIASVNDGSTTFFIDINGKIVRNLPSVAGAGTLVMQGNVIKANVDQRISYYDKSGKIIWKQDNSIRLNDKYKVKEKKYKPNRNYLVYYPEIEGMKNLVVQEQVNRTLRKLSQAEGIDTNKELDYSYQGDFAVTFFQKNLVVIQITGYNYPFGAAHGMPTQIYAHVDLMSGAFYQLKDLFKPNSNYVKILSDIIREQIIRQGENSSVWLDSYKGIEENQPFFVTMDALNIYFYPYDIAPYAAGFPTFKIPFRDIMYIINTKGEFWKSFHY